MSRAAEEPWFTCITVLTLALGIGANTAIFGVVNKLLLNPLPYPDAERIVYLQLGNERGSVLQHTAVSSPARGVTRRGARRHRGLGRFATCSRTTTTARACFVGYESVPGLPAFLGVSPALGRGFTAADAEAGAPAVVMLGYEVWQRDYGGSRDVLGRALTLDEVRTSSSA